MIIITSLSVLLLFLQTALALFSPGQIEELVRRADDDNEECRPRELRQIQRNLTRDCLPGQYTACVSNICGSDCYTTKPFDDCCGEDADVDKFQCLAALLLGVPEARVSSAVESYSAYTANGGLGCALLSGSIASCVAKTPNFAFLPASRRAECACYQGDAYNPWAFDQAYDACDSYLATASPTLYDARPSVYSELGGTASGWWLESPCSGIGNVLEATVTITAATTIDAVASPAGGASMATSTGGQDVLHPLNIGKRLPVVFVIIYVLV